MEPLIYIGNNIIVNRLNKLQKSPVLLNEAWDFHMQSIYIIKLNLVTFSCILFVYLNNYYKLLFVSASNFFLASAAALSNNTSALSGFCLFKLI